MICDIQVVLRRLAREGDESVWREVVHGLNNPLAALGLLSQMACDSTIRPAIQQEAFNGVFLVVQRILREACALKKKYGEHGRMDLLDLTEAKNETKPSYM